MNLEITRESFRDLFAKYGRQNQFSYEGINALYDELEDAHAGDYSIDIVSLCCDYAEYASFEEFKRETGETKYKNVKELAEAQTVIKYDGGLIVKNY